MRHNVITAPARPKEQTMAIPAQAATPQPTQQQKTAALRRLLLRQLIFDLGVPLGGYYGLRALGMNAWVSLVAASLLAAPAVIITLVKQRKVDVTALFTLSLLLIGALMSLVTGDPRVLLVRDSWLTAALGLWVLGTLPTQRPFARTLAQSIVIAKIGAEGHRKWDDQWHTDPAFRRHLRVVSAVWGLGLTLDAGVRVVLAYALSVDLVPAVSTAQWLVVLAGLIFFHIKYVTRHGLKV